MNDEKQLQPQVNFFNPPSIDFAGLLMRTHEQAIQTDRDLRALKEQYNAGQAQIFSMFNEVKNDMNTVSASLDRKIDQKVGDVRDDIGRVDNKVSDLSKAQTKQTLILAIIFTVIIVLSKAKLPPEILSILPVG